MPYDQNNTIAQFLEGTAAKQAAPGGGSATALVGALAAAVGEMVVQYSVGRKGFEAHQDELESAMEELRRARQLMLALMAEDQIAFEALAAAGKLPKGSAERRQQVPAALLASIRTPEAMAATAAAVLEICERLVEIVNPRLLSDLAVCADLAMATVRCGLYNVRVNLAHLEDVSDRDRIEGVTRQILTRAAVLIQQVAPRIWERHDQGK